MVFALLGAHNTSSVHVMIFHTERNRNQDRDLYRNQINGDNRFSPSVPVKVYMCNMKTPAQYHTNYLFPVPVSVQVPLTLNTPLTDHTLRATVRLKDLVMQLSSCSTILLFSSTQSFAIKSCKNQ